MHLGFSAHFKTVNALSNKCYLNCDAKVPRGWCSFTVGEYDLLYVLFMLWS